MSCRCQFLGLGSFFSSPREAQGARGQGKGGELQEALPGLLALLLTVPPLWVPRVPHPTPLSALSAFPSQMLALWGSLALTPEPLS